MSRNIAVSGVSPGPLLANELAKSKSISSYEFSFYTIDPSRGTSFVDFGKNPAPPVAKSTEAR